MKRQLLEIFFLGACLFTSSAHAVGDHPEASAKRVVPVAVFIFAQALVDPVPLQNGGIISPSELSPPLSEYIRFLEFSASERATFLDSLDVVTVIQNDGSSSIDQLTAEVTIYGRVGPFLLHPKYGVTDIERGWRQSKWETEPLVRKVAEARFVDPRRFATVTVPAIEWKPALNRLSARERWAFEIEVRRSHPTNGSPAFSR